MANQIIPEEQLRDDFLSAMIRSDETASAPKGFIDSVMSRISILPSLQTAPYKPPVWLKWGVPGVIVSCLLILLFIGPADETAPNKIDLSVLNKLFNTTSTWLSGISLDMKAPDLTMPENTVIMLIGGMVLFWGFWLLSRFLERKHKTDH